jgi:hypothetical protein
MFYAHPCLSLADPIIFHSNRQAFAISLIELLSHPESSPGASAAMSPASSLIYSMTTPTPPILLESSWLALFTPPGRLGMRQLNR